MTNDNQPQPDGFPSQPIRRPAPRQPGQPAGTSPTTGPLPMGPPPGSTPGGVPTPMPTAVPGQPTVPTYQPAPGVPVDQPNQVAQFGTAPPVVPGAGAVGGEASDGHATKNFNLLPFAIAAGILLSLAGIGVLALLATRGGDESEKGKQTASARTTKSNTERPRTIRTPTRRQAYPRRTVDDVDSQLGQVPMAIDEDEVLAHAADPDGLRGTADTDVDGKANGLVLSGDDNAFDGKLPSASDLDVDNTDGVADPMEPAEETEEEKEEAVEEEPEDRPDPFADFPDRVGLTKLAGPASGASPITLGPVHLLDSDEVSFALRHGESALGPKGRFAMEPTDEARKAQAMLRLAGGRALPVAEVSADNNELKFQWLADGATREADYLRNCSLLVTVGDQSRAMALREADVIDPWKLDPSEGGATYDRKLDSVPKSATLGVEILELSDRFPAHTIVGGRRLKPSKRTLIKMQGSAKEELFTFDIVFRPSGTEKFSLIAKTLWPEGAKFNPKSIPNQIRALQARRLALQSQRSMPASSRAAANQQIDAQIARYQELQDACDNMAGGAEVHFRVFMDFGGLETDLLTSKAPTAGAADSLTASSGSE